MDLDPIVEVLRDERRRRELSLRDVAVPAGLSPSSIERWEKGERGPSLRSLRLWAGALGFQVGMRR